MHAHAERTSKSQATLKPFVMLAAALACLHVIIISTSEGGWASLSSADGFMHDHLIQLHSRKVGTYLSKGKVDDALVSYSRAYALLSLSEERQRQQHVAAESAATAATTAKAGTTLAATAPPARLKPGTLTTKALLSGTVRLLRNSGYADAFLLRKIEESLAPHKNKMVMKGHHMALKHLRATLSGESLPSAEALSRPAVPQVAGGSGGKSGEAPPKKNATTQAAHPPSDDEKTRDEL